MNGLTVMPKSRFVKEFFFSQKGICFGSASIKGMSVCFIMTGLQEACNETRITKMQKSEYFTEKTLWYPDLK